MRFLLAAFSTLVLSVAAFAADPAGLSATPEVPAPAAVAVLLLGIVGVARRRRG